MSSPDQGVAARLFVLAYGLSACVMAVLVSLYFLGFLLHTITPTHLGHSAPTPEHSGWINVGLLLAWGLQHSVMARTGVKQMLWRKPAAPLERSTYVMASSLMLGLVMWCWQPMVGQAWQMEWPALRGVTWFLFMAGLALVLYSAALTDGADLLGWRQAHGFAAGVSYRAPPFTQRSLYRVMRHPMMLGVLLALWATPEMTTTHLMFSVGMSVYILLGMHFEEASMLKTLGDPYRAYRQNTWRLIPWVY